MIFKAFEDIAQLEKGGKAQIINGIQEMIDQGLKVYAVKLPPDGILLDIGNLESCWRSFNIFCQSLKNRKQG
jgi:UTP-glucose-1-phosphate uridylyltransferase